VWKEIVSISKVPDSRRSRNAIQEDLNQGLLWDEFKRLDQEIFRAALHYLKVELTLFRNLNGLFSALVARFLPESMTTGDRDL